MIFLHSMTDLSFDLHQPGNNSYQPHRYGDCHWVVFQFQVPNMG